MIDLFALFFFAQNQIGIFMIIVVLTRKSIGLVEVYATTRGDEVGGEVT